MDFFGGLVENKIWVEPSTIELEEDVSGVYVDKDEEEDWAVGDITLLVVGDGCADKDPVIELSWTEVTSTITGTDGNSVGVEGSGLEVMDCLLNVADDDVVSDDMRATVAVVCVGEDCNTIEVVENTLWVLVLVVSDNGDCLFSPGGIMIELVDPSVDVDDGEIKVEECPFKSVDVEIVDLIMESGFLILDFDDTWLLKRNIDGVGVGLYLQDQEQTFNLHDVFTEGNFESAMAVLQQHVLKSPFPLFVISKDAENISKALLEIEYTISKLKDRYLRFLNPLKVSSVMNSILFSSRDKISKLSISEKAPSAISNSCEIWFMSFMNIVFNADSPWNIFGLIDEILFSFKVRSLSCFKYLKLPSSIVVILLVCRWSLSRLINPLKCFVLMIRNRFLE